MPTPAPAATPAPQTIEITGGRESDTAARRQSTAAKIIIGREEIDKFGDSTLGEVLRRLPGVTTPGAPGRGGPPRLRGLGNDYTQLLIDGQRIPPGFSLESLTPEQVERIEILRAPTAETGARAIAGTINIITREGFRRRLNDVRLAGGWENDLGSGNGSWAHNDSAGALTYNLSASGFANRRRNENLTDTTDTALADGALLKAQQETSVSEDRRRGLNLTARLQWRLSDRGDLFALTPSVFHTEASGERRFTLAQSVPAGAPAYDLGDGLSDSRFTVARLGSQWRQRLAGGTLLELTGNGSAWRAVNGSLRRELRSGNAVPLRTLQEDATTRERTLNLSAKFTQVLGGRDAAPGREHSLVGGFEVEALRRSERRSTLDNGAPQLAGFGADLEASSTRMAAYLQDEWSLTTRWSAHAGARWEGIATRGDAADGARPSARSSVFTPLLHAVWKPDPKGRDQVRFSLTRSYRAPGLGNLIARPTLSSKFPASGPNDPTSPDRAGNPNLQPELATGLDVAVERYLPGGGLLSANLFHRQISDLLRGVTALETVPWSSVPRWVTRQQNVGDAVTQGLELEAKFALDQAFAGAPRVELRGNLSLYRSRVDGVPGPDNRLDQQAKATANLGADYRFRGTPLTLGGNLNWVPGYDTRVSEEQTVGTGRKRVVDAFALWTFNPQVGLRLLASNLDALDYESRNTIRSATFAETARSVGPTDTNWQLRLELKL